MDAAFFVNTNDLLRRCDAEQRALELTHPTPEPRKERVAEADVRSMINSTLEKFVMELAAEIGSAMDERIMAKLEKFSIALGKEVGEIERRIRKDMGTEVGQLRALEKWKSDAVHRVSSVTELDLDRWKYDVVRLINSVMECDE